MAAPEFHPCYLPKNGRLGARELTDAAREYEKAPSAVEADGGAELDAETIDGVNQLPMNTKRVFHRAGGKERPHFKHQIYAPGRTRAMGEDVAGGARIDGAAEVGAGGKSDGGCGESAGE